MCSFLLTTLRLVNLTFVNHYLRFRGPDITAHRTIGGFEWVHNLLSQTGSMTVQPLLSADGRVSVLFNGEIYNFRHLEQKLRPAGPPYPSDGAAIIDAYAKWGGSFARHLDGEFAIAIVDFKLQKLLLAVDPFGVKPLFMADDWDGFGASSYRSGLVRAGHKRVRQLDPNMVYVYSFDGARDAFRNLPRPHNFRFVRSHVAHTWKLRQCKKSASDWETAFLRAVAKRRAGVVLGRLFLPLSSGFDAGAIHLALTLLRVPHSTYSVVGRETAADVDIMRRRIEWARQLWLNPMPNGTEATPSLQPPDSSVFTLSLDDLRAVWRMLNTNCEPYTYEMPVFEDPRLRSPAFMPGKLKRVNKQEMLRKDSAVWGVAHICSVARKKGQSVLMSGSGADETMTDYGFAGRRHSQISQFGGFWPNDTALASIFPWYSFMGGTQQNYLAKDEYVTGSYGVEGRFPFLDPAVVQETISLAADIKNEYYKAPVQLFFRRHNYPHQPCVASSRSPFGEGVGCKKLGFSMFAGKKNIARKTQIAAEVTSRLAERRQRAGRRLVSHSW